MLGKGKKNKIKNNTFLRIQGVSLSKKGGWVKNNNIVSNIGYVLPFLQYANDLSVFNNSDLLNIDYVGCRKETLPR